VLLSRQYAIFCPATILSGFFSAGFFAMIVLSRASISAREFPPGARFAMSQRVSPFFTVTVRDWFGETPAGGVWFDEMPGFPGNLETQGVHVLPKVTTPPPEGGGFSSGFCRLKAQSEPQDISGGVHIRMIRVTTFQTCERFLVTVPLCYE